MCSDLGSTFLLIYLVLWFPVIILPENEATSALGALLLFGVPIGGILYKIFTSLTA